MSSTSSWSAAREVRLRPAPSQPESTLAPLTRGLDTSSGTNLLIVTHLQSTPSNSFLNLYKFPYRFERLPYEVLRNNMIYYLFYLNEIYYFTVILTNSPIHLHMFIIPFSVLSVTTFNCYRGVTSITTFQPVTDSVYLAHLYTENHRIVTQQLIVRYNDK